MPHLIPPITYWGKYCHYPLSAFPGQETAPEFTCRSQHPALAEACVNQPLGLGLGPAYKVLPTQPLSLQPPKQPGRWGGNVTNPFLQNAQRSAVTCPNHSRYRAEQSSRLQKLGRFLPTARGDQMAGPPMAAPQRSTLKLPGGLVPETQFGGSPEEPSSDWKKQPGGGGACTPVLVSGYRYKPPPGLRSALTTRGQAFFSLTMLRESEHA